VYDAHEAVVCFLSDEVDGCMDEFKEEWESVSKIVVIAREGTFSLCRQCAQMTCEYSGEYGEGEAVGRRAVTLVRLANRRVHLRVGT
jgi:hypothetical protein